MTRFKDLLESGSHREQNFVPSVSLSLKEHSLHLKLNQKDIVTEAAYSGKANPWLGGLCEIIKSRDLQSLLSLSRQDFDSYFKDDADYWTHREDSSDDIFAPEIELLKATLDSYRGRDDLYLEKSPLICRCFGVREDDVRNFLKVEKDPTLEKLSASTKASLGCRSCLPQLKRWLMIEKGDTKERVYKGKPVADWLLEIDYMLSCFPQSLEWGMKLESFKNRMVIISYTKATNQKEAEEVGVELQRFLAAGVDEGLSFFLRRA